MYYGQESSAEPRPKMARANTYIHYSPGMQEELSFGGERGMQEPYSLLPELPEVKWTC